jgi:hypothetical protein
MKKWFGLVVGVSVLIAGASCTSSSGNNQSTASAAGSNYTAQTRAIEMVTIQELIGEFANIPDLKDEINAALKPNGPLEGHEVYAWYPSSLTAYVGDTVKITIHNGQGDQHIFSLPDFGVTGTVIPPDSTVTVSFKVTKPNTFRFFCAVPEHMPWMQGFLTVLPDNDAG